MIRIIAMTGPGPLNRIEMERLCKSAGLLVLRREVKSCCDALVASRTDSSKARSARHLGTKVMTYDELMALIEQRRAAGIPSQRTEQRMEGGAA